MLPIYAFAYYFIVSFVKEEKIINDILFLFIVLCGICCIWGIGQFIYLASEKNFNIKIAGIWSFFNNPNIFANYLIMMLPISTTHCFSSNNFRKKISFIVTSLIFLSIVLTTSRVAYFILLLQLIFIVFFIYREKIFFVLTYFFTFFLIISISYLTLQKKYEPRIDIWKDSISIIKEKPFSGFGISSWDDIFPIYKRKKTEYHIHSHNLFLQVAIHGGMIYLFLWLWLFVAYILSFLNSQALKFFNPLNVLLGISIFSFLFYNIFDYFLNIPILGVIFFILLGMSINLNQKPLLPKF